MNNKKNCSIVFSNSVEERSHHLFIENTFKSGDIFLKFYDEIAMLRDCHLAYLVRSRILNPYRKTWHTLYGCQFDHTFERRSLLSSDLNLFDLIYDDYASDYSDSEEVDFASYFLSKVDQKDLLNCYQNLNSSKKIDFIKYGYKHQREKIMLILPKCLSEKNYWIRYELIKHLCEMGDINNFILLVDLFENSNDSYFKEMIEILLADSIQNYFSLNELNEIRNLLASLDNSNLLTIKFKVQSRIQSLKSESVELTKLNVDDSYDLHSSLYKLLEMRSIKAVQILIDQLKLDEPSFSYNKLRFLVDMKNPIAEDIFINFLNQEKHIPLALKGLGNIGGDTSSKILINFLKYNKNPHYIRDASLSILKGIHPDRIYQLILNQESDEKYELLRQGALQFKKLYQILNQLNQELDEIRVYINAERQKMEEVLF